MLVKKSALLRIRLEPELYAKIKSVAQHNRSSVSRYVRKLIESECSLNLEPAAKVVSKPVEVELKVKKATKRPKQKSLVGSNGKPASSLLAGLLNKAV